MNQSASPVISIPRRNIPKPNSPPPSSHSRGSRSRNHSRDSPEDGGFSPHDRPRSGHSTPSYSDGRRSAPRSRRTSQDGDVPWTGSGHPGRRDSRKRSGTLQDSFSNLSCEDSGNRSPSHLDQPRSRAASRSAWDGPSLEKESASPVRSPHRRSKQPSRRNSYDDEEEYSPRHSDRRGGRGLGSKGSYDYDDDQMDRRGNLSPSSVGRPKPRRKYSHEHLPEEGYVDYAYHDDSRPSKPRSRTSSAATDQYARRDYEDNMDGQGRSRSRPSGRSPRNRDFDNFEDRPRSRTNTRSQQSSPVCSPRYGERSRRQPSSRDWEDEREWGHQRSSQNAPALARETSNNGVFSPMYEERDNRNSRGNSSRGKYSAEPRGPARNYQRASSEEDDEHGSKERVMSCRSIDQMMRGVEVLFNIADFPQTLSEQAQMCSVPLGCPGTVARALIHRQEGLAGKINPLFKFTLEGTHSDINGPSVWSKKSSAVGVNVPYLISLERVDLELPRFSRSDGFIGKLSNKGNGKYVIYNAGCNPDYLIESDEESCEEGDEELFGIPTSLIKPRCEFGCVTFNKDMHRPQMEVGLPNVTWADGASTIYVWQPRSSDEQMLANFQVVTEKWGQNQIMTDRFYCLSTEEVHRLVGTKDHRGRVVRDSVKNFQIVLHRPSLEEEDCTFEEKQRRLVWLQMHKVDNNIWSVEFIYPLSILQAFSICLARFDHRFK